MTKHLITRAIVGAIFGILITACQAPVKTESFASTDPNNSANSPLPVDSPSTTEQAVEVAKEEKAVDAEKTQVQEVAEPRASENPDTTAFSIIASVLQHPRCLNCHVAGDTPKQGDDRRDHMPSVKRGSDGRGSGLTCNICHQSSNGPVAPGAPDWHLAPVTMNWEGLSAGDLCRTLTDNAKNGGRDLKALAMHLTTDPIVQWGWEPGGTRKPVPVSKEEFAKQVNAWVDAGGACPN